MDLNSFPGHLLQEDFGGPSTSLSPPHFAGACGFTGAGGWTQEVACVNFFMYAAFDFGLPCAVGSVTTGPRYAIRLVKGAANVSNVKVKRISLTNIVIILKSQCSLGAAIASQSNSTETCLTENGLRKIPVSLIHCPCPPCVGGAWGSSERWSALAPGAGGGRHSSFSKELVAT